VAPTQAEQSSIPKGGGDLRQGLLAARSVPPLTPTTGQTTATTVRTPSIARGRGHAAMQTL